MALRDSLETVRGTRQVVAAVHHVPFAQLLPGRHSSQWDFAKAYLGSERIGALLMQYPNIGHVLCGHSHLPLEATIGPIHAINIGSGYTWKTWRVLELPD